MHNEDASYIYSFGVKDYPIGQIVNVARKAKFDPNAKWEDVGSYFSIKKRLPRGSCYNIGPNAKYEHMRNKP